MNNKVKKAKKAKNTKRLFILVGISGVLIALAVFLFFPRPRMTWYVDEDISADWIRILRDNPPPFSRYEIVSRSPDKLFPSGGFGFIISRNGPQGEREKDTPFTVYNNLSRTREYGDWFALALDPWMVFYKHRDAEPQRTFLDNENRRGSILLAGNDNSAIQAWLSQIQQESPGAFKTLNGTFEDNKLSLARSYPFQSDALSYSWMQVWPLVYRNETAYLYAPLSQARRQPPFRMGLLGTARFPEPQNWDRYGLQAEILWAKTEGTEQQSEMLLDTLQWLKEPLTQTAIANTFQWIPAHPSGYAQNTISSDSQIAWLRSSYIWQEVF